MSVETAEFMDPEKDGKASVDNDARPRSKGRTSDQDGREDRISPEKGTGIFKVRPSTKTTSGVASSTSNQASLLQNRINTLGVSTDSTEPETSSMDLPTITVSEDELHDTMSDVSSNEGSELEDDGAGTAIASCGPSISARGSREDVRPSKMKKASSNPSLITKSSIRSKVKVLGGKVKEVWGGISSGMHLRRSPDDISSEVSKIISTSSPVKRGGASVSDSGRPGMPEVVTIEVKKLVEIMKKDQELKRKEEEIKKLESQHKKEGEWKKKEEQEKRKKDEKKMKAEEERLYRLEKELLKREKEDEEKLARKEMELIRKEKEISTREALLEKRMAEFERRCNELDIQMKQEKELIDREKENLRRDRVSLSGDNRSRDREGSLTYHVEKDATLRPSRSEDHLTGIDPLRPRRKRDSQENLNQTQWNEYRRKLPPPPRPPLPRPPLDDTITAINPKKPKTEETQRVPSPTTGQQSVTPPPHLTTTSITSAISGGDSSMKTALSHLTSGTPTLFRISPTSSSSSIYCSDFMDIPFDVNGPARASVERDHFDPKLFYAMIVTEWRKKHPRRVLKETRLPLPPIPSRSHRSRTEQNEILLKKRQEIVKKHQDYNYDPYARARTPPHFVVPSTNVIYALPHKSHDDGLRSYNYRLQKKKDFYAPFFEENPYDELIFPIPPVGRGQTCMEDFEIYPPVPPRMKRGRSKSNLRLDHQPEKKDTLSSSSLTHQRADPRKSHLTPTVTVDFITTKVHHTSSLVA